MYWFEQNYDETKFKSVMEKIGSMGFFVIGLFFWIITTGTIKIIRILMKRFSEIKQKKVKK